MISKGDCLLCWGLMTRQPLWVIFCRLPEKGREEIVEEMKERDREERNRNEREEIKIAIRGDGKSP